VDDVARDEVPRTRCVVKARDNEVQPVALCAVISNQMLGAFGSPRVGVAQRGQQKGFFPTHVGAQPRHELLGFRAQRGDRHSKPFHHLVHEAFDLLDIPPQPLVILENAPAHFARFPTRSSRSACCNSAGRHGAFGSALGCAGCSTRPHPAEVGRSESLAVCCER